MKHGYSNLLGETVPAHQITRGDCEDDQIVCPECRAPVMKKRDTVRDLHYLSHYRRTAHDDECELRVDAIGTSGEIAARNEFARKQGIAFFVARFDDMVRPYYGEEASDSTADAGDVLSKAQRAFMERNKLLPSWRTRIWQHIRTHRDHEIHDVKRIWALWDHAAARGRPKRVTGIPLAIHRRIVEDMFTTMLTPAGRGMFDILFNISWYRMARWARMQQRLNIQPPDERAVAMTAWKALKTSRRTGDVMLLQLGQRPWVAHRHGSSLMELLTDQIFVGVLSVLAGIDYATWLRRRSD